MSNSANVYINPKPFWQQRRFIYICIAVAVLGIITALGYSTNQKLIKEKEQKLLEEAKTALNTQTSGSLKSYRNDPLEKKITVDSGGKTQSFNLQNSTVTYKCSSFSDINTCSKTSDGIRGSKEVEVFAKGTQALYILFK